MVHKKIIYTRNPTALFKSNISVYAVYAELFMSKKTPYHIFKNFARALFEPPFLNSCMDPPLSCSNNAAILLQHALHHGCSSIAVIILQ